MKQVDEMMKKAVLEKIFPGAVLLVSESKKVRFFDAYGYADIFTNRKMTEDTVFDLASLTKPLATTPAIMKLVEEKKLDPEQTLKSIIPEIGETDKKDITISQLLYHSSGLLDYVPFYKKLGKKSFSERKKGLRRLLLSTPLMNPPGKTVLYSDLGFMLLNWVVERISGKPLNKYLGENVYSPMGLSGNDGLFFIDLDKKEPSPFVFAATEYCPWRKMLLDGVVHDENAYAAGGVEGHAGLFGSAKAVHRFLCALMDIYFKDEMPGIFSKDIIRLFLKRDERWGRTLGFDTPASVNSSAGKYFSEKTVGHLGFTGTSFWMDFTRAVIVILLTNRVHPKRENEAIRQFRPLIHNAVMEEMLNLSQSG